MDLLDGCSALEDLEIFVISFHEYPEVLEIDDRNLPKLVKATVLFCGALYIPVKAFRNVQFLTLDECEDTDIHVFPNLIHMEFFFNCSIKWSVVLDMLNHCPKLQTVVFELQIYDDNDEVWPDPGFVPECFSSHLNKCYIKGYTGEECQMRFVRYVMQNSTSLRTMIICSRYDQNHERRLEVITELASYTRSSAVCELLFK
ncbi:putative FBD-associated F-box protein At5g56820 [Lotus japonicus]|uniref:putative FBD-associated F-box protein At5g56820 n=1 Tax=Lotus japonicus TaxID=34305 RepID=UPI00258F3A66|nr:putative FBD-associated F-box protein At5g56820 [Lotus japonicus]